jgi:thiol-disulfide isomerase/thioredoxin
MVVQLSSLDRNCGPCLSANAEFRDVQRQVGDQIKLVQTVWPAPWSTPPVEIQAFMRKHQINALPSRLAFENGELVGKQIGWTPGDKGGDALLKPGTAGADVRPAAAAAPVQIVSARDATEVVARSKGYLVVQVSSFDTRCSFCGPSNDAFDALSRRPDAKGTKFVRVTYQPWTSMSQDAFAQSYGVNGLPTFFTMKDGQLVRRQNGIAQPDELHRLLLEGLD